MNLTENSKYQLFLNRIFIEKIEKDIKKQKVFNYGCGNPKSYLNTEIRRIAREVVEYDKNIDGINVMEPEVFNTIDVIIAARVFEELKGVEQREFFHFCNRLLKPNGLIIILVPNAESFNREMGVYLDLLESPYELSPDDIKQGHVEMYSEDTLNDRIDKICTLQNLPFDLEDTLHLGFKPYPMSIMDTLPEDVYIGGQRILESNCDYWGGCAEIVSIWRKNVEKEKTVRIDLDYGNQIVFLILKENETKTEEIKNLIKDCSSAPEFVLINEKIIKDIIIVKKEDPNIGIAGNNPVN